MPILRSAIRPGVRRIRPALALAAVAAAAFGCVRRPSDGGPRPPAFRFDADTFAFANETVWEYRLDAASGRLALTPHEPPPDFALQCGNLARAARQFHVHARFDPSAPRAGDDEYDALVRAVLQRDPRGQTPPASPVVIPGYADLRTFSHDHAAAVKRLLYGPWTFLQRGNWRMIFPFPPAAQRAEAERLAREVRAGDTPIVHVLRYPLMSLNHVVLIFDAEETPTDIRFRAYDPNDADVPIVLRWDRGARTFVYPPKGYFLGGPVRVYEIFDGLAY